MSAGTGMEGPAPSPQVQGKKHQPDETDNPEDETLWSALGKTMSPPKNTSVITDKPKPRIDTKAARPSTAGTVGVPTQPPFSCVHEPGSAMRK